MDVIPEKNTRFPNRFRTPCKSLKFLPPRSVAAFGSCDSQIVAISAMTPSPPSGRASSARHAPAVTKNVSRVIFSASSDQQKGLTDISGGLALFIEIIAMIVKIIALCHNRGMERRSPKSEPRERCASALRLQRILRRESERLHTAGIAFGATRLQAFRPPSRCFATRYFAGSLTNATFPSPAFAASASVSAMYR